MLRACIVKLSGYEQGPEPWLSPAGQAALADMERLVEAARLAEQGAIVRTATVYEDVRYPRGVVKRISTALAPFKEES